MDDLLLNLSFFFSQFTWLSLLDIALVTAVIYALLRLVRGTQGEVLLRGVIVLVVTVALLNLFLPLQGFSWLLQSALPAILVAIPVIFATEIRRALERLGRAGLWWPQNQAAAPDETKPAVRALVSAAWRLSQQRHGGLMVIERATGLKEHTTSGVPLDAVLTDNLLLQIFYPNTPLHDGAVIVNGNRIVAAACVMPLTTAVYSDQKIGLRHRAALGITEVSDALAIVVSEETGSISVVHNGRMIRHLDRNRLKHILNAFYNPRHNPPFAEKVLRVFRGEGSLDEVR